jgi:pyruvate dehydrogenase E2 component (dihydrolipoamide acetyltransferase)
VAQSFDLSVVVGGPGDCVAAIRPAQLLLKVALAERDHLGGGFSISNLGIFGIRDFLAVINPPQACILALGAGENRPVAKGDEIRIATVMSVGHSTDHRVVDGALGAQFLQEFKRLVEDPLALLL